MAFANYADLKNALNDWLARSDVPWSSVTPMVEAELNRTLVSRLLITTTTLTLTAGTQTVALPTDFVSAESVVLDTNPRELLETTTISILENDFEGTTTARPEKYAIVGSNLKVGPPRS